MEVTAVPMFESNYGWIIRDEKSGKIGLVDPAQPAAVKQVLKEKGWSADFIFNTHHHNDHVGGNLDLKSTYKCTIVGPKADQNRIPGIDIALEDGDTFQFGEQQLHVFDTPGHTRGHCTFWFKEAGALFPGDTLFFLGCGRLFEGDPAMMWSSLSKLKSLPDETKVYCAHEYTAANAKFAVYADPKNAELQQLKDTIDAMRSKGERTIPSTIAVEKKFNPFLRPDDSGIREALNIPSDASNEVAFGVIRKAKDNF